MGSFYYVVVILEPKSPIVNLNCTNPLKPTPRNNKKPYPSNMSKLLFLPLPIYHDRKTIISLSPFCLLFLTYYLPNLWQMWA